MVQSCEQLHLWDYLKAEFGWNYKIISNEKLKLQNEKVSPVENVHFFHGHDVDREMFTFILRTFVNHIDNVSYKFNNAMYNNIMDSAQIVVIVVVSVVFAILLGLVAYTIKVSFFTKKNDVDVEKLPPVANPVSHVPSVEDLSYIRVA